MENQKLVITKSNELIENYIFNATELELQILNYAVATLNPAWENNGVVFMLSVPDIAKTFNAKSNNAYKVYKEALRRLMDRKYSYYNDNGDLITENLVIRTRENAKDTSWLEFKFNERISQRLSKLKELFTSYDIKHIANFKSRYAFMLYEFFKMKIQQSQTDSYNQKISVEDFKENLDISNQYKLFSNLKQKVLEPAKTNINKHSDITVSYKEIKTGKKVTHLKFIVKHKKTTKVEKIEEQKELSFDSVSHEKRKTRTPEQVQNSQTRFDEIKKNLKKK